MSKEFWLGCMVTVLVGIPGTFLMNILSTKAMKAFEKSSTKRRIKYSKNLENEYEKIKKYKNDPVALNLYLISILVNCTGIGALGTIVSSFAWMLGLDVILNVVGNMYLVIMELMIFTICNKAYKIYQKIKDFDTYKTDVEKVIGKKLA